MNICTKLVCVFCHLPSDLRTFFLPKKSATGTNAPGRAWDFAKSVRTNF